MTVEEITTEFRYAYKARVARDRVYTMGYHVDARDEGHAYRIALLDRHLKRLDAAMVSIPSTMTTPETDSPPTTIITASSTTSPIPPTKRPRPQLEFHWTVDDVVYYVRDIHDEIWKDVVLSPFAKRIAQYIAMTRYMVNKCKTWQVISPVGYPERDYGLLTYAMYLDNRIHQTPLPFRVELVTKDEEKVLSRYGIISTPFYVNVKLLSTITDMSQLSFVKLPNGDISETVNSVQVSVIPALLLKHMTNYQRCTKMIIANDIISSKLSSHPMIADLYQYYRQQCQEYAVKHRTRVDQVTYQEFCHDLENMSCFRLYTKTLGTAIMFTATALEHLQLLTLHKDWKHLDELLTIAASMRAYGDKIERIGDDLVLVLE